MSTGDVNRTVADWVLENPGYTRLFERLGIDYCCGGQKTLAAACAEKGLDAYSVAQTLNALSGVDGSALANERDARDWTKMSLTDLCDNIEQTHHRYVRDEFPRITNLLEKVARVHGDGHPELHDVQQTFAALGNELLNHLRKEEMMLFPAIRQLDAGLVGAAGLPFGTVANPIRVMIAEHESAGHNMGEIRRLTADYQPPEDACSSYRVLLGALQEWEKDLHQHIHKENNVLFPRAVALEGKK